MQESLVIKECKRCGSKFIGGRKDLKLEVGQQVEIINAKVASCQYCPDFTGPRTPGYARID